MNSLANEAADDKLDRLLIASVSPGAEPAGFRIGPMPARPVFCWSGLVYALAGVGILGFFMTQWLLNLEMETINTTALLSVDELIRLIESMVQGHWATMLGLAAAAWIFLPEKLKSLYQGC